MSLNLKVLMEKMQTLSPDQIREVEDFVDFVRSEKWGLDRSASAMSERSFAAIWTNPEDDVYDAL